jgi:hypothetical protein
MLNMGPSSSPTLMVRSGVEMVVLVPGDTVTPALVQSSTEEEL